MSANQYISNIRNTRAWRKLWDRLTEPNRRRFLEIVREDDDIGQVLSDLLDIQEGR